MYALSEKVYKYRRSGTQKHFHLKEADIFVFTVLYYKRALTTRQITQLYSAFEGRECSEASIFTKLDRYSQYGAMLTKRIDKRADSITKRALFSLKEKTIEFLLEIGRIPKKSSKRRYSRTTSLHTMCSREVMIRTLLATTKKTQTNEVLYELDIRSFYQKKNIKIEDNQLALIPDEHISYQDKNIHIEMDMCKETNSILVEKVEKYIEYAKKNK